MTSPYSEDGSPHTEQVAQTSIGELIGNISNDLSTLFRQEVELAKAELKQEASKAGKAAGMLGVATGLANIMDAGWAALIVAVLWGIVGAVLSVTGRNKLKTVDPVPHRTVDTIKEDAQWLKNPTS